LRGFCGRGGESWEQGGNLGGIIGEFGEELAKVLFFELDNRQVNESEDGGEEHSEPEVSRGGDQAGGDQQGAEVERVAQVRVGSAAGELSIFRDAAGGPAAEGESTESDVESDEQLFARRVREQRENRDDEEAAGHAEAGDRIGVAIGERH